MKLTSQAEHAFVCMANTASLLFDFTRRSSARSLKFEEGGREKTCVGSWKHVSQTLVLARVLEPIHADALLDLISDNLAARLRAGL